jgi:hypothetical protein
MHKWVTTLTMFVIAALIASFSSTPPRPTGPRCQWAIPGRPERIQSTFPEAPSCLARWKRSRSWSMIVHHHSKA